MAAGMVLSTALLVAYPPLFLAISDSLSWRLGTPPTGQAKLENTLRAIHLRGDSLLDSRSTLLMGDSHLHSFPASILGQGSVNYSIAGETADHLADRVTHYDSLGRVKQVVLLTGRNDLDQGRSPQEVAESVVKVLGRIPDATPVLLIGIPPVRKSEDAVRRTQEANRLLKAVCEKRARCAFVGTEDLADPEGLLRTEFAAADGVHLTHAGYTRLARLLDSGLHSLQQAALGDLQ